MRAAQRRTNATTASRLDWGTHVPFRVSDAAPHVGRAVVINLDLKDFFPSITFRRVKGLFHALGYAEHPATLLALLRTEPPRVAAGCDGKSYRVALGKRALPHGVCTSLAIINALCRRLDRPLVGLARRHGFTSIHSRYVCSTECARPRYQTGGGHGWK